MIKNVKLFFPLGLYKCWRWAAFGPQAVTCSLTFWGHSLGTQAPGCQWQIWILCGVSQLLGVGWKTLRNTVFLWAKCRLGLYCMRAYFHQHLSLDREEARREAISPSATAVGARGLVWAQLCWLVSNRWFSSQQIQALVFDFFSDISLNWKKMCFPSWSEFTGPTD